MFDATKRLLRPWTVPSATLREEPESQGVRGVRGVSIFCRPKGPQIALGLTTLFVREPNQQGFQRSRALGGETHFFHPSTDTKQEIAVMCESTCPVVMADAHL